MADSGPDLLEVALGAARAAADLIRDAGVVAVAQTKSSEVDPVTEVDRASEALIRARITALRPEDAIRGEEGDDRPGSSGVRWIVDPIDGTVNFLYGIAQYAVSIAAESDGQLVAGVVINVRQRIEYAGWVDADGSMHATRDGIPIKVREEPELSKRLVATGFSYDADVRVRQARSLVGLIGQVRDIRRGGSAALDLCGVADGSLDGYLEEGVHEWDYAAGGLIAVAAGARMEVTTGASGRTLVICAASSGFEELRVAAAGAGYLAAQI